MACAPVPEEMDDVKLTITEDAMTALEREQLDIGTALGALANLLRNIVPVRAMCDPRDFGVLPMIASPFDRSPALYLWDRVPGGIGLARLRYEVPTRVLLFRWDRPVSAVVEP